MKKILTTLFLISCLLLPVNAEQSNTGSANAVDQSSFQYTLALLEGLPLVSDDLNVQQRCCKICKKGKACGNSCISRSKTCHQPPGCACNARQ